MAVDSGKNAIHQRVTCEPLTFETSHINLFKLRPNGAYAECPYTRKGYTMHAWVYATLDLLN